VSADNDAVETVVYQCQQAAKERGELFHANALYLSWEKNGEAQTDQAGGGQVLG
jgi:hypothetical protein